MPAELRQPSSTLLAIKSGGASWSLPGAAVTGVERLSDWSGPAPLDVLALLGAARQDPEVGPQAEEARVVVLETEQQRLPLLAQGALSLVHTTPEQLLELPDALRRSAPLISQVALVDGLPALFVLSPRGLLEAWHRSRPPTARELQPSSR